MEANQFICQVVYQLFLFNFNKLLTNNHDRFDRSNETITFITLVMF